MLPKSLAWPDRKGTLFFFLVFHHLWDWDNPHVALVPTQKEAEGRTDDSLNLEKTQCCDKHTVGPLFTLCPDVAWDRGSFVTTRVGPKSAGISVPAYGVTTRRDKNPRMCHLLDVPCMPHAASAPKPCEEDAGLSGISRPSLRSHSETATVCPLTAKFKWPNTFSILIWFWRNTLFSSHQQLFKFKKDQHPWKSSQIFAAWKP